MNKEVLDNKIRRLDFSFIDLTVERILSCKKETLEIIGFKKIFSKLGTSFQIKKPQIWKILYILEDLNKIKIIAGHGIIINDKRIYNDISNI